MKGQVPGVTAGNAWWVEVIFRFVTWTSHVLLNRPVGFVSARYLGCVLPSTEAGRLLRYCNNYRCTDRQHFSSVFDVGEQSPGEY